MKTSQHASLIHLSSNSSKSLNKLPLFKAEGDSYSEDWLQDLIFRHPDCLPIQELDSSYGPLIPVCRELETAAGPIDILFINPNGMLTIVECKLWRNPEARREVVGQILDYAKELGRWRFDDLQREVSKVLKSKGNKLFEIVCANYDIDESVFIDNVSKNLREGKFQLLIVGDGIRHGVEVLAEYLKGHAGVHFSFGLVEVAVFGMENGDRILQPRVLAKTSIIERYTIQLGAPELTLISDVERTEEEELSETQIENQDYWKKFLSQLKLDDVSQNIPEPTTRYNIWLMMPKTKGHVWITVYRTKANNQIGVFLKCMDKSEIAKEIYSRLKEQSQEIETSIGSPVNWEENGKGYAISLNKSNPKSLGDEAAQIKWLTETTNKFVNVFRPRIEALAEELNEARIAS